MGRGNFIPSLTKLYRISFKVHPDEPINLIDAMFDSKRGRFIRIEGIVKGKFGIAVGIVKNITLEGLYLRLEKQISFSPEESVRVGIFFNDGEERSLIVKLPGKAVRISKTGVAIKFQQLAATAEDKLKKLISDIPNFAE